MAKKGKLSKAERKAAKKLEKKNRKLGNEPLTSVTIGDFQASVSKDIAQNVRRYLADEMEPAKSIKRPDLLPSDFLKMISQRSKELAKDMTKVAKQLDKLQELSDDRVNKEDDRWLSENISRLYSVLDEATSQINHVEY